MAKVNKTNLIVTALERGQKLTQKDATDLYGVTRLAAAIHLLKKRGMPILDRWVEVPDRFGNKCEVKEYWLQKDEQLSLL